MVALLFHPDGALVTGVVEDRETGGVRVYVGARYRNVYGLVVDPEACEKARRAWAATHYGHLLIDVWELVPLHNEGRARERYVDAPVGLTLDTEPRG